MAYCPNCKEKVKAKIDFIPGVRSWKSREARACPECKRKFGLSEWKRYQIKHKEMLIDAMVIELKPCPFCGSKAKFIKTYWVNGGSWSPSCDIPSQVKCTRGSCGISMVGEKLKSTKKWNERK